MAAPIQTEVVFSRPLGKGRKGVTVWVTAREAFWVALEALRSHKLRSFLTLLGVVIATTTLIVVMSIVNGMNVYIAEHIANLGHQHVRAAPVPMGTGLRLVPAGAPAQQADPHGGLRIPQGILQGYERIGALTQLQPNPAARYKTHVIDEINLNGMTPSFVDIGREKIALGRYISDVGLPAQRAGLRDRTGPGGQALPQCRSAGQGSIAGGTAVPRDRSDGAAGQHLRAEPGQFRHRSADHISQHLDGPARIAGLHQSAGRARTWWSCRTRFAH